MSKTPEIGIGQERIDRRTAMGRIVRGTCGVFAGMGLTGISLFIEGNTTPDFVSLTKLIRNPDKYRGTLATKGFGVTTASGSGSSFQESFPVPFPPRRIDIGTADFQVSVTVYPTLTEAVKKAGDIASQNIKANAITAAQLKSSDHISPIKYNDLPDLDVTPGAIHKYYLTGIWKPVGSGNYIPDIYEGVVTSFLDVTSVKILS